MKSIQEIKEELKRAPEEELPALCALYQEDGRKGVQSLLQQAKKRLERLEREKQRIEAMRAYEEQYGHLGYICGIDEVGRGPFAGPVVAGAVILPRDCRILYINDSKKLSAKKREELSAEIQEKALAVGIGLSTQDRIDEINILQATYEAMRKAIASLSVEPSLLLNDAVTIPAVGIPQVAIVKGDARSISIGAASIVAKVYRDRMMEEYDKMYQGYGFASNKGYGSKEHIEALHRMGPCPLHRRSFLKSIL